MERLMALGLHAFVNDPFMGMGGLIVNMPAEKPKSRGKTPLLFAAVGFKLLTIPLLQIILYISARRTNSR
jgi:hypothetical protein